MDSEHNDSAKVGKSACMSESGTKKVCVCTRVIAYCMAVSALGFEEVVRPRTVIVIRKFKFAEVEPPRHVTALAPLD